MEMKGFLLKQNLRPTKHAFCIGFWCLKQSTMKTTILSILLIASIQTFTGCREVSYNVKAVCVDKQVLCDKNGTPSFLTIFKIEDGSFKRTYGMANYYTSEVGKTYTFEESKFEWK